MFEYLKSYSIKYIHLKMFGISFTYPWAKIDLTHVTRLTRVTGLAMSLVVSHWFTLVKSLFLKYEIYKRNTTRPGIVGWSSNCTINSWLIIFSQNPSFSHRVSMLIGI